MELIHDTAVPISKGTYNVKYTMTAGTAALHVKQSYQSDVADTTFDLITSSAKTATGVFTEIIASGEVKAILTGDAKAFIMKAQ